MYKKRVILLFCIIIVYIILSYIYSVMTKENLKEVYVITKEVKRGEEITLENSSKIKIDVDSSQKLYLENIENILAKFDLKEGQILSLDNVIKKEEYTNAQNQDNEIVIIDLSDFSSSIQSNLSIGMMVNLYYTGRSSQVENFFNNSNYKKVKSSNISDSYTTVLLLENITVKEVYDKNGKVTNEEGRGEKIALEVDNNMAIMTQNIKNYGTFSVTIKR